MPSFQKCLKNPSVFFLPRTLDKTMSRWDRTSSEVSVCPWPLSVWDTYGAIDSLQHDSSSPVSPCVPGGRVPSEHVYVRASAGWGLALTLIFNSSLCYFLRQSLSLNLKVTDTGNLAFSRSQRSSNSTSLAEGPQVQATPGTPNSYSLAEQTLPNKPFLRAEMWYFVVCSFEWW